MFFEKDDHPTVDDPVFDKIPTLKYFKKTRKFLRMQRAFVTPRYEVLGDSEHNKCIPNMETIREAGVPPKYQEEGNLTILSMFQLKVYYMLSIIKLYDLQHWHFGMTCATTE